MIENEERFEKYDSVPVLGGTHCVGTEPELLECTHYTIGNHHCGGQNKYSDIIISCTGMCNITHSLLNQM